jgi:hypothetical protein
MSDFLGNIGNFFGSSAGKGLGEIAGLGATGAGLVGNLAADRQRSAAASAAQKNMNLTPQQLAAQVTGATQPLNAGLIQAITGNVNANLAEQGLSQAPGIQATALAQALAGPEQQNQDAALRLVLAKLGLPEEFLKSIPPNANLSPLLAMLMKGFGGSGSTFKMPFSVIPPNPENQPQGNYDFGSLVPPVNPDTTGSYDFGSLTPPSGGG